MCRPLLPLLFLCALPGRLRILLDGENLLDQRHKDFPAGETLGRRMGIGLRIRLPG